MVGSGALLFHDAERCRMMERARSRKRSRSESPVSRVQSIERAFAVLAALGPGPLGVTEVAERVRLPKSTVARLLTALAAEGAVERVPGGTDYRIGELLVGIASHGVPARSLIALARPQLVELAAETGEAAGLSIPDGFLVHYIDQEDSPNPVGVRDWTGTRLPMHAVSSGIMFLANLPPEDVDRFLQGTLERFTAGTVTAPQRIRERLRRACLDGVAWTRDEVAEGISSVAAAVADEKGEVIGAVHVHGPSYRFPGPDGTASAGDRERIEALVVTAAARVSRSLRKAG
jgi:DNA-binding IclR family transcriptional regulator